MIKSAKRIVAHERFEAEGVPRVTAPYGTPEWEKQVVAYDNWLDSMYAQTDEAPFPIDDEWEDEGAFYNTLR